MNWNFLISFGVGCGIYFLIMLVVALIKRHKNKTKFLKEVEHKEGFEEGKDEETKR